jgi:two-component system, OmpR family, alkaline phosphatase synthesis response regulator PhoP
MGKSRILVVDDNETIRKAVSDHFSALEFDVLAAKDGIQGLDAAIKSSADVIILDVNLPGLDGFRVCQFLRERGVTTPIIMLTSRAEIDDKVTGFGHGADDYLAKPFSPVELEIRVSALMRRAAGYRVRSEAPSRTQALERGALRIDIEGHAVSLDGKSVDLTPIEFNILKLLASSPGKVYSREELLDLVWDTSYAGYKRNIDPHINRLRSKIEEDPRRPRYIQTVWGVGYRFGESGE